MRKRHAARGGSRERARASRILAALAGSVTTARTASRPPHLPHWRTSVSNVLWSKSAHSMRQEAAKRSPPRRRAQCATESTFGAGDSTPGAPAKEAALATGSFGTTGFRRRVAEGTGQGGAADSRGVHGLSLCEGDRGMTRHGARVRRLVVCTLRPRPVVMRERLGVQAAERGEHGGLRRRERRELEGERQHVLSKRRRRKNAVHQMRSLRRHAPPRAARTQSTILARERDQQIVPARLARRVYEAAGKITAAQVASELVLHVTRKRALVGLPRVAQKLVPVLLHQPIEHRRVRTPGKIRRGKPGHASRVAGPMPTTAPWFCADTATSSPGRDGFAPVLGHPSVCWCGLRRSMKELAARV